MNFTKLEKGKLIDAHPGFVDSWNRMVDCWNNFVGRGLAKMLWIDDFHPILDVQKDDEDDEDDEEEEYDETDDIIDINELILPPFDPCGPVGGSTPAPFEIVSVQQNNQTVKKVVNCSIPCPVTVITASDYTITSSSSDIYLHITYSSGAYTASVNQTSQANTTTHAQFKLYEYANDAIVRDWRPKALPLFAL